MKKYLLLLCAIAACSGSFAQKSKKKSTKGKAKTTATKTLATSGDMKAEAGNGFLVFYLTKTDTVHARTLGGTVSDVKITPFTSGGAKLCSLSWTEKKKVGELKTKLEESTSVRTEIYDPATKANLFTNTKTDTDITEVVFLDKVKVVSETQYKKRHEGMDLTITPAGDLIVKGKSSETKYVYNADQKKFLNKK
ncbi:hypothetical protein [Flavobacterium silvaticum]|uniref:LPS export ABC transporter periplasmic protein LptC n=1 Tax=Flavobacterium silvaticum TaxID=1852020 RepID=A0A972FP25_9FLAO|nr:hypothetical protein [Flavobacterium silvaticum]NMH28795.1 hypothetical protein [Flavobacterium silvaticum]